MSTHGHLTAKQKKEIRAKRRALRKDLKARGIGGKEMFEAMAQEMGYVYGAGSKLLGPLWWLLDTFGAGALGIGAAAMVATLGVVTLYSNLYNSKDQFTIALTGDLENRGFILSETPDFEDSKARLTGLMIDDANAISIQDIPDGLDDVDGEHNGQFYVAYTFYVKNVGRQKEDYDWNMIINEATRGMENSVWVMIYREEDTNDDFEEHDDEEAVNYKEMYDEEGNQIAGYDGNDRNQDDRIAEIYAMFVDDERTPEHLSGYDRSFFEDVLALPTENYLNSSGKYGIRTTPFIDSARVAGGTVTDMWPGEVHKYTVVMWIEGDDPECTNEQMGGYMRCIFKFSVNGEETDIFDEIKYDEGDYIGLSQEENETIESIADELQSKVEGAGEDAESTEAAQGKTNTEETTN